MSKHKDASTCDERQVKNKPNRLTHKRKGETRRMSSESMKHWKVSLFFVISLMLVVGLFGDTAQAEFSVTTNPTDVASQAVLRTVMITYKADADKDTANVIGFALPTGWEAAYANDGGTGGAGFGATLTPASPLNVIASTGAPAVRRTTSLPTLVAGATRSGASYVEVVYLPASGSLADEVEVTSANDGTVTVTVPLKDVTTDPANPTEGTKVGDRVVVTYYNVRVALLADTATVNDMGKFEAAVPVSIDTVAADPAPMIDVRYRHPSTITVTTAPSVLKPLAVAHVTVKYQVREAVIGDNAVAIDLPTSWMAAYRASDSTSDTDTPGFGAEILTKAPTIAAGEMRSYVMLTTTLAVTPETTTTAATLVTGSLELSADGDQSLATITPTATAPAESMQRNNVISLTYYNVKVPQVEEYQLTANRDDVSYDLTVTDSVVAAGKAVGSGYTPAPVVKVRPPKVSTVTVSPTSAPGGSKKNVMVTYTAKDMIHGTNIVSVELPVGWEPYFPPQDKSRAVNSFGSEALTEQPRSSTDRNKTSYVLLKSTVRSDTSATDMATDVKSSLIFDLANARLDVTVPGGMVNGDKIEVTFYNVKVEELIDTDHKDAALIIEDSIVGSDYAKTIEVIPPKLGNVTILSGDSVTAEDMVDFKIRYTATSVLADDDNSGRIRVKLPAGWGPPTSGELYPERQPGNPEATYLSLAKSSGVMPKEPILTVGGDLDDGYMIDIDVDKMTNRHQVTLTIHNLMIAKLMTARGVAPSTRHVDITKATDLVQVMVSSSPFDSSARGEPLHSPATVRPKIPATTAGGSDTQPTIKVNRKTLGDVTVAPNKVPAGSKQDFTITYKVTEKLNDSDVIEIALPPETLGGWAAPTVYQLDDKKPTSEQDASYVYLSGSASRLAGTMIKIIDALGTEASEGVTEPMGWIVQITLGTKGASKNSTVVLKYNDVTVQRGLATGDDKLVVKTFSGSTADGLPQYPVKEQPKDTIEVINAADGSGMVTFEYDSKNVTSVKGKDHTGKTNLVSNTTMSIPAGLAEGDLRELDVTYKPVGDMGTKGEFEFRLPSGWSAVDSRVSGGGTKDDKSSGNTVVVDLDNHFGESDGDSVVITFADITVPKDHGVVGFTAKSTSSGTLKQLSPKPSAFVGNAEATHDTVGVKITPAAAYENEENVDFEIELTNVGPLHNSEIRITVPEGIFGLQTDKAANANYVKRISTTAMSVDLGTLDIIDEDIVVSTGKLNAAGKIRIRFDNVDLTDGVSTDASNGKDATTGFRVATRTRVDGEALADKDYADLEAADYIDITKENGDRSIMGGLIRTVAGSGEMTVEPMIVEQNSSNVKVTLTYTAKTDVNKKNLVIQMPSVIDPVLQEDNSAVDGYVSTTTARFDASIKAADRLKIGSGSTITWTGVKLREGQTFVTVITGVDFLEFTGNFSWDTMLDGVSLVKSPATVVVGTTEADVAFEIVDNIGVTFLAPHYPAASKQSIRFQFTAENTAIRPGGILRFKVPGGWTMPSVTDRAGRATVGIVSEDADGNEIVVSQVPKTGEAGAGGKMVLSTTSHNVNLTIGAAGGLARGDSVMIQYGTADLTKFPAVIPASVSGTADNLADGFAIHGSYRASDQTGWHNTGAVRVDVTNVEDGTGTVTVTPPSVRASSTDNLIRITYTAIGTMDGGSVRLIIPDDWGAAQRSDNTAANYVDVDSAGLDNFEVLNSGRSVEANLTTLGKGDTVMFSYGAGVGANRGAAAQAEIGEATFGVQSKGSSGGDFVAVTDTDSMAALTIEVKGAASGSGMAAVSVMKNKAGEADGQINAGDDKTYLVFTYTASQSIAEGELELTVPSEWTAPQQEDANTPGYTYIEEGNALVSDEEYDGQSVTATIQMEAGNVIKIHYGWYDTENGGAHAPDTAGTSVFEVQFDGSGVAMQPSVIVHGGTPTKLMVDAPATVSADEGADPVAITVEIQDDTDAATVMDSDLAVTLITSSPTGSFTDADGEAIANNMVTISAGMTGATVHYSDTTVGTAMLTASAVGLAGDSDSIEVTTDIDRVDADSITVSPATPTAGVTVMVSADGTAGRTATFSVGDVVTDGSMAESPAGSYSGTFTVVDNVHDGTHDVTVTIGTASETQEDAVTIDTTAPVISSASASPATVGNGDMVTISATVTGATSVTADVSALDDTQTDAVPLTMANGSYSASVTISADNAAANGAKTITVTAMDDAGNSAMSEAMVTLDNKLSYTSMIPVGQSLFHVPLDVEGLDTIGDLKTKIGNGLTDAIVHDTASGNWLSREDDMEITAGLGILLVMSEEASVTFEGQPWGGGAATLSLGVGLNLVGLGVNDSRVTNVSDIIGLFPAGAIASITVSTGDAAMPFDQVTSAADTGDRPVVGDTAYLVSVPGPSAPAPVALIGTGWSNGDAATAPIALAGYNVDGQTAVLDVSGAVVDEITGLASEGFRVKVKNLSTKASLTRVSAAEIVDGYNMTFVDLKVGNAARIGDVLEISADSPNPLIGVKPMRHVVTVDDVKNSRVMLENLIAYEIPAETALLRNYPNPFNPETWIPYHLSEDADVSLTIYDVNGALVRTIDVGHQIAAKYDTRSKAVYWDGRNQFGEQVASGIYFYSLSAGDFSATRKMVILK